MKPQHLSISFALLLAGIAGYLVGAADTQREVREGQILIQGVAYTCHHFADMQMHRIDLPSWKRRKNYE